MNAFCIPDNKILVVTKFRSLVFNENLEQIQENYFRDYDIHMERLYCFNVGKSNYLIGCDLT